MFTEFEGPYFDSGYPGELNLFVCVPFSLSFSFSLSLVFVFVSFFFYGDSGSPFQFKVSRELNLFVFHVFVFVRRSRPRSRFRVRFRLFLFSYSFSFSSSSSLSSLSILCIFSEVEGIIMFVDFRHTLRCLLTAIQGPRADSKYHRMLNCFVFCFHISCFLSIHSRPPKKKHSGQQNSKT